jgi:hypothetical protein
MAAARLYRVRPAWPESASKSVLRVSGNRGFAGGEKPASWGAQGRRRRQQGRQHVGCKMTALARPPACRTANGTWDLPLHAQWALGPPCRQVPAVRLTQRVTAKLPSAAAAAAAA